MRSEGLPEGSEGLPEGFKGLPERPKGLLERPKGLPEGPDGLPVSPRVGGVRVIRGRDLMVVFWGCQEKCFLGL